MLGLDIWGTDDGDTGIPDEVMRLVNKTQAGGAKSALSDELRDRRLSATRSRYAFRPAGDKSMIIPILNEDIREFPLRSLPTSGTRFRVVCPPHVAARSRTKLERFINKRFVWPRRRSAKPPGDHGFADRGGVVGFRRQNSNPAARRATQARRLQYATEWKR